MSGPPGFKLETVFCEACSEAATAIPTADCAAAQGLPEGWVVVEVRKYQRFPFAGADEPTRPHAPLFHYYCSEEHLPEELQPGEAVEG